MGDRQVTHCIIFLFSQRNASEKHAWPLLMLMTNIMSVHVTDLAPNICVI